MPFLIARRHRHVDAAPVLVLVAVVGRGLNLVVHLSEPVGSDVVQTTDRVAAAAGKTRIDRRRDVVGRPVGGLDGQVAAHVLACEPPLVPLGFSRHPRRELLLHGDADLVVPRPQAVEQLGAVGEAGIQRAEVVVRERAAAIAARRRQVLRAADVEVAVDDVVAVGVRPASGGGRHDGGRRGGASVDAAVLCRLRHSCRS